MEQKSIQDGPGLSKRSVLSKLQELQPSCGVPAVFHDVFTSFYHVLSEKTLVEVDQEVRALFCHFGMSSPRVGEGEED